MTFPVYIPVPFFDFRLHPHLFFDFLAYTGGFRLYLYLLKRRPGPNVGKERRVWIFIGCIFGALFGAKIVAWLEAPATFSRVFEDPRAFAAGKSIVGGLMGGWLGVELAKLVVGVRSSTGDAMVFPVLFGMAIGRWGCFFTGLDDDTFGLPTSLPFGVDFGDGIARHPTQLYESASLVVLAAALYRVSPRLAVNGQLFRLFIGCYMAFRFFIEFLKPRLMVVGPLSPIQLISLLSAAFALHGCWSLQAQREVAHD